ncbi:PiggyBac transposable element-derived protein, partial [Cinara cedri]
MTNSALVLVLHTLFTKGTYCTGTLRANRKGNPKKITSRKLKLGESVGNYTKEGVCVMKWQDRQEVLAISSKYTNDLVEFTNRR